MDVRLAGGLLLAFHVPVRAFNEPVQAPDDVAGKFAPNAFVRIDRSGTTRQGVYTSIPMILTEELDADLSKVALEHAPPNDGLYANPTLGYQVTGNSNSARSFWQPLRRAGATARALLIQAAAEQWSLQPTSCTAANGWTREEDTQHDFYRPVYRDTIAATLSDGKIASWKYRISGPAIFARRLPAAFRNGIDIDTVDSAINVPYDSDYRMLRIDRAPKIDVHIVKSGEHPGGIGETGVTAAAPALCNAIFFSRPVLPCGSCR
jgi:CO/xanthine dehydrogenase Mo-binding subunit